MYEVFQSGDRLFVNVQSPHLLDLATVIVVPLVPVEQASPAIDLLNPVLEFNEEKYVFLAQAMAAVPTKALSHPIGRMTPSSDAIRNAIDSLFFGF